ncbi:cytochrome-c oxidase, cbb3-type subunit III [Jiella endophytica]|uniref:Cbb3-type cytochrome c oxidase subunit n=1 Tax=Jiella endophytica TaxID=2558362 RepID=A0A4Y8RG20_9HYPH|nr:cytochrome-c oxidase, cbb3-type subunit III [Jiella endophytica]TFF20653.1 cytochrome-c oxidase, cbb3-type subunit III [Jiella endophytica]TFF26954.1 cytochrome-c oxidase, cbb3-type subunit III [Jiella endophytica]
MAETRDVDQITGVETTGHSWDGIKELNNPLPRWWLWTFYGCIAFALVYTVLYPAWPMINSATGGLLGWSSRGQLEASIEEAKAANAGKLDEIASLGVEEIAANPELRPTAIAAGKAAFKVNCVQCHGSGAEGGPGYPNLNDDSWLWGGSLDAIHTTLEHGIRYATDDDTRISEMPAFGRDGVLDRTQIGDVAEYVLSLGGRSGDEAAVEKGQAIFADNCAACHGEKGEGMHEIGAPRLNDAIWLYGSSKADIVAQVTAPRHGVMPAWGERLGETTVKELTVYVHSLGGGE